MSYYKQIGGMSILKKKEKIKRSRIYQKICTLLMKGGWHWEAKVGLEAKFSKVSRAKRVIESGLKFELSLFQPCRSCWITIKSFNSFLDGTKGDKMHYAGRLLSKKDLKHIERLLNIK